MASGQGLQVLPDDGQGGARLPDPLQLQGQALGQLRRPDPRRFHGFQQGQRLLQPGQGDASMAGQLLQGGAQVAVVVQAVDQIAHQTGAPLLQLEPASVSSSPPLVPTRASGSSSSSVNCW